MHQSENQQQHDLASESCSQLMDPLLSMNSTQICTSPSINMNFAVNKNEMEPNFDEFDIYYSNDELVENDDVDTFLKGECSDECVEEYLEGEEGSNKQEESKNNIYEDDLFYADGKLYF